MGKPKRERSLADNEALAVATLLRTSPRKLDLVAGLIRGLDAGRAVIDAGVLAQADRARRQEDAAVGDRQCREQPQSRRRPAVRGRGQRRQAAGDEAHARAGPRPRRAGSRSMSASCGSSCASGSTRSRPRRRPPDGPESQSDRAPARHQPDLGFALVRRPQLRQAAGRGSARSAPSSRSAWRRPASAAIVIERPAKRARITIHTARPGRGDRQEGPGDRGAPQGAGGADLRRRAPQHQRGQEARARRQADRREHRAAAAPAASPSAAR